MEDRQRLLRRAFEPGLIALNPGQRIGAFLDAHAGAVQPALDARAVDLHPLAAGQADNGVAAPLLAALDGFKQIRIGRLGQFAIGREGGVEVGENLAVQGHAVIALRGQRCELFGLHGIFRSFPFNLDDCASSGWAHEPGRLASSRRISPITAA